MDGDQHIAYFSMEIGLEPGIPTYSGGLGILAGDTLRAAADVQVPMVGVTLLHRCGYFYQRLDAEGRQQEEPVQWVVEDFLEDTGTEVTVTLEGRQVLVRGWKYEIKGESGFTVPVYLLDTDLDGNSQWDRTLTHYLYGGDAHYRLCQETVLGMGGVRLLRALGYDNIQRFHLNEGHASLLTMELLRELRERDGRADIMPEDLEAVRRQCVFTTHTPVPAGHDQFPLELVDRVMGGREACGIHDPICHAGKLNMTYLALALSHYVNGVAKKHGEVSRHMFAGYRIDSITNGVHAATWTAEPVASMFDRHIPGWRQDNFALRYALKIPADELWEAHRRAKRALIGYVNRETNAGFDFDVLTIGFARRAATYKRADLIFHDVERLQRLSRDIGRLQLVFAGKAHPQDGGGKELIQRIFQSAKMVKQNVRVAYLPNYEMSLGKLITAGVDVWLNTPEPPLEASGTSGMKAALNGVPSLSVLDGWWIEGCIEGLTGWAIGDERQPTDRESSANALYEKLEQTVIPVFYGDRSRWLDIMRHAIALNGSFFNTQRMILQYTQKAYM
jgi:starch phosphorylase